MYRPLLFILLLLGCTRSAPTAPLAPEHRAAIVDSVTTMLTAWREAVDTRDADRVATFYADGPEFRWIEDGMVRYTSRQQVLEAYRGLMPSLRALAFTLDNPQVTPLAPGVALVTTVFTEKLTDTLGTVTGFAGTLTLTVVHADSGWRFLAGHTSSVIPRGAVPGPKAD
jgi:uncharacterized protein (TIGR02246 family)